MKGLVATLLLALRVRPSFAFLRRQVGREPGVHEYTLRASGRRVLIRHDHDDPHVLAECFGRLRAYEAPPAAAAALLARPPRTVLDLGANIGFFGLLALDRYPGCAVTGFEPDPANADLHQRCIEANGLAARWRLERAFAARGAGRRRFSAGRSSRSRLASEAEPGVEVDAVDVLPLIDRADLVKIDIEGAEWELLADPRLASAATGVIVLECHGNGCPGEDPAREAAAALAAAGFATTIASRNPAPKDRFEGHATIWAWREGGR